MARLRGPFGLRGMIGEVARFTDMLCREAPAAIRRIGADAIISDQMEAAGGLVADHLGLPSITVATALPINREPGVPPPYVPWPYDPSERGRWWNEGGYRISDLLMRRVGDVIERHSRAFGLSPRRRAEDCVSPRLQIAQAVRGLDFPRAELPASFHYLGPFRSDEEERFELPDEDGRPIVFCSLGTLQGSRASIFRKVSAACATLPVRLVIAHGGGLDAAQVRHLPGKPLVFSFVPQRVLLRRSALAVTHAGFNTVLDALSFGVPMVAMPLAFEQPATGARLKRAGVAEVLGPSASVKRLRKAIATVIEDPAYRSNAADLAAEIGQAGGVRRAADLTLSCLS
jgi:MGT family glycosyltransferase